MINGAVLVVDDEAAVSEVIAELLASDGHAVETVSSGAAALEKLRARSFDLVLCDLRMPGIDGSGVYREAQRIDGRLAPRFVFLTGDVFSTKTTAFLAASGAPCLAKPFRVEELQELVGRSLDGPPRRPCTAPGSVAARCSACSLATACSLPKGSTRPSRN